MFLVKNNKSPYYQIVWFPEGKKTTQSTKTANKKEALRILFDLQKNDILQSPKSIIEKEQKDQILLITFKEEYVNYLRPIKSKKYIESIELSFNQLVSFSANIALTSINTKLLDQFISATFARTQRGAHHYFRTLRAAFNKAVEWNYIQSNPFAKIKFPKLTKSYPVFINEDELFVVLSQTKYQYLKELFTTAFYTGMRLGEIINMQWNWIVFSKKLIIVKCTDSFITKNKKERIIPMNEKVFNLLTRRMNLEIHFPNEPVFYRLKGKKLHNETVSKQFKTIVKSAQLNELIHFHSLRHSFASTLVQKGVSLFVVKELLGHEDLATTQIYSHLQKQNLFDAVNLL